MKFRTIAERLNRFDTRKSEDHVGVKLFDTADHKVWRGPTQTDLSAWFTMSVWQFGIEVASVVATHQTPTEREDQFVVTVGLGPLQVSVTRVWWHYS